MVIVTGHIAKPMKVTLDHNVLIDLAQGSPRVASLRQAIDRREFQPYVAKIGASEMRERGVRPDRYDLFEKLLGEAGLESAILLNPIKAWDVTFWDQDIWADQPMIDMAKKIDQILFGGSAAVAAPRSLDSPEFRAWLNRHCDVHTMWCHIYYGNDVFVTSDANFLKATKLPQLIALGAGRILRPKDF